MFQKILVKAAATLSLRPDPILTDSRATALRKTRKSARARKYQRRASGAERDMLKRALCEIAEHIDDDGIVALEGTNEDWAAYEKPNTLQRSLSPDTIPNRFTVWRRLVPSNHREPVGDLEVQVHNGTDQISDEHVRRISVSIYRAGESTPLVDGANPSRDRVRRLPRAESATKWRKLLRELRKLATYVFVRTDKNEFRILPQFLRNLRAEIRKRGRIRVVITATSFSIFVGCYWAYYYASHRLQIAVATYAIQGSRMVTIVRWKPNGVSGPYKVMKNGTAIGETQETFFIDPVPARASPADPSEPLYRVSGRVAGLPRVSLAWSADDRMKKSEPCILDGKPDLCAPMRDLANVLALPFERYAEMPPIVAIVGRPITITVVVRVGEREGEKITLDRDQGGLLPGKPRELPVTGNVALVDRDQLERKVSFDEPGMFPLRMRDSATNRIIFSRLVRVYSEAEILRDARLIVDTRGEAMYGTPEAAPLVSWDTPAEVAPGVVLQMTRLDPFAPSIEVSRRGMAARVDVSLYSPSGNEVLIDYGDESGLQRTVETSYPVLHGLVGRGDHRYSSTVDVRGHELTISGWVYQRDDSTGAGKLLRIIRKRVTL
jgi:hypothetical protein